MSLSPNTLAAFVARSETPSRTLDVATIESRGMVVSEGSGCEYCFQSHLMLGTRLGKLDASELELNRHGGSSDPKRAAAVRFARAVADTPGKVSDEDIAAVRAAGFSDAVIVAIAGLTAQFLFTNFVNNIAQAELDFPADAPTLAETAAPTGLRLAGAAATSADANTLGDPTCRRLTVA